MNKKLSRRTLGPAFSEGARLLWGAIDTHGTQEAVAKFLGIARGVIPRLAYGDRGPSLRLATLMSERLGIPSDTWTRKPKRTFVPPAARAA